MTFKDANLSKNRTQRQITIIKTLKIEVDRKKIDEYRLRYNSFK